MRTVFFWLGFKNLLRHKRKAFTTGLSIALGFAGTVLLGGYMVRMEKYLIAQGVYLNHVGHVSIYKKDGLDFHLSRPETHSFSPQEQQIINEKLGLFKGIEKIGRFIHGTGLITNGCKSFPFLVWATEAETEKYVRSHPIVMERIPRLTRLSYGKGFWEGEEYANGILVTKKLANLLNKPLAKGDVKEDLEARNILIENCESEKSRALIEKHSGVQLLGNGFHGGMALFDTDIVGHFSSGFALSEDSAMQMSLEGASEFFGTENITSIGVFLKHSSDTEKFMNWIRKEGPGWGIPIEVYDYQNPKVNPFYVGAMRFVYIMNLFFLVIVCGVVVLSIINSIQISIFERKNEIGSLRSMGFRQLHVQRIFEAENLVLTFFGLSVGALIAFIISTIVNSAGIKFDIVGNAQKIILKLEMNLLLCSILFLGFLGLVWITTKLVCKFQLNRSLPELLERGD